MKTKQGRLNKLLILNMSPGKGQGAGEEAAMGAILGQAVRGSLSLNCCKEPSRSCGASLLVTGGKGGPQCSWQTAQREGKAHSLLP